MLRILIALLAALLVSTHAYAYDSGFYTGFGYGVAYYKNKTITEDSLLLPAKQKDISENYFELYAGYSFNKYFSLEFGYANFSEFNYDYSIVPEIAYFAAPNTKEKVDMQQFSLGAVLEYPLLKQFSFLGIIGYSYYEIEGSWSGGFSERSGDPSLSFSNTKNDLLWGLGCKYDITKKFSGKFKWTSSDTSEFDISAFNLSVEIGF